MVGADRLGHVAQVGRCGNGRVIVTAGKGMHLATLPATRSASPP
jgi:hypothetical protein